MPLQEKTLKADMCTDASLWLCLLAMGGGIKHTMKSKHSNKHNSKI